MPINIYSQYTKPQGYIKFDPLINEAKKYDIKALALTDHGNFSGIKEFYQTALNAGIKPIIGIDLFCKLSNNKFARCIFYIKNENGYRSILKLINRTATSEKGFTYIKYDQISGLEDLILMINLFKTDYLSLLADTESDINELDSGVLNSGLETYFQIIRDDNPASSIIFSNLITMSENNEINIVAQNPVYYLKKDEHVLSEFVLKMSGIDLKNIDRNLYLGSLNDHFHFFPEIALKNKEKIIRECNFILDEIPLRYPDFKLKTPVNYSYNDTLKSIVYEKLKNLNNRKEINDLNKIINAELAYVRKFNIADYIIFLKEFKEDYKADFKGGIFFSGFVNDLFIAHILGLTWSSPLYITRTYHRAMLQSKRLLPVINVIISSDRRGDFIMYLKKKFGSDRICYLSEYVKWHPGTLISTIAKEYHIKDNEKEILNKLISELEKNHSMIEITGDKEFRKLLDHKPEYKKYIEYAVELDAGFKNFSTNSNQIVVGKKEISKIIPVINDKINNFDTDKSFYDINTAKYFGIWNINIESHKYLSVLNEANSLLETDSKRVSFLTKKLKDLLLENNVDQLPFFNYSYTRLKFLDCTKNNLFNLALYLESARTDLERILEENKNVCPVKALEKDLKITGGYIVFREQLFYVCEKLFTGKEYISLKQRLYSAGTNNQFNNILNRFVTDEKNNEKVDWIRNRVLRSAFYSTLTEKSLKIFTVLKILDMKLTDPDKYFEIFFTKEIEAEGDWGKYLEEIFEQGFTILPFNFDTVTDRTKYSKEEKQFTIPLFVIKGISRKVSDHISEFVSNNKNAINNFRDFLDLADKETIKHNIVSILINVGFFDRFENNRRKLLNINDLYFKNLKKDLDQNELFSIGYVEMQDGGTDDISIYEKIKIEKELVGFQISKIVDMHEDFLDDMKFSKTVLISKLYDVNSKGKNVLFYQNRSPVKLNYSFDININEENYYKVWYDENNFISRYKIMENIYLDSGYRLYMSITSDLKNVMSDILELTSVEGNCEIEIVISDNQKIVRPDKKILLSKSLYQRIKKLLKDIPFYFEVLG